MNSVSKKIWLCLAHCLILALLLFPVWYVDLVPMLDFPGHLSRIHVLLELSSNTTLAQMYEAQWEFVPNIGIDLFVLAAAKFVPLVTAGKLFISVSIVLWMVGTAWLNRVLSGRWSIVPLFAAPFVLNSAFFLGLMNFTAASGVALVGLAAWAAMESWKPTARLMCILPLTIVAYFTHFIGFVFLACCMLGFELGRELAAPQFSWRRGLHRLALATAALLPVVAIFLFLTPHQGHNEHWVFGDFTRVYTRIGHAAYLTYGRPYYLAIAFMLLVGGAGLVTRTITIDRRMWPVLVGLGIAAVVAPIRMLGGAFVEIRLPPVIGCLFVASVKDRANPLMKTLLGCILAGLLVYRAGVVTETWTAYDRDYAELAAVADRIEPGSKVFVAQNTPKSAFGFVTLMMYSHYMDLIGVQRNLFTPTVMAWPAQHQLRHTQAYDSLGADTSFQAIVPMDHDLAPLASNDSGNVTARFPHLIHWQCTFDYLVNSHLDGTRNPAPAMLKALHTGSFFTLYKVVPDGKDCR